VDYTAVSTPAEYEIPFDDLELRSADGTKVKAYLMKQRKELVGSNEAQVPENLKSVDPKLTDDEVAIPSRFTLAAEIDGRSSVR